MLEREAWIGCVCCGGGCVGRVVFRLCYCVGSLVSYCDVVIVQCVCDVNWVCVCFILVSQCRWGGSWVAF